MTRSRLFRIAFYTDLVGVRALLALAELVWAVTLIWPGETFGRPTYTAMAHVMPEEAWALVFLMSSSAQSALIMREDFHSGFAKVFAAWNSALWWFVVVAMYLSVYPPPAAISGELALALGASWIFIRTGYIVTGKRSSDAAK